MSHSFLSLNNNEKTKTKAQKKAMTPNNIDVTIIMSMTSNLYLTNTNIDHIPIHATNTVTTKHEKPIEKERKDSDLEII